jgi:hypothetical protein
VGTYPGHFGVVEGCGGRELVAVVPLPRGVVPDHVLGADELDGGGGAAAVGEEGGEYGGGGGGGGGGPHRHVSCSNCPLCCITKPVDIIIIFEDFILAFWHSGFQGPTRAAGGAGGAGGRG